MQAIRDILTGRLSKVGERTCEDCGSTVPIYEKDGEQTSVCITCENKQLEKEAGRLFATKNARALNALIEKYETTPYTEKVNFKNYSPATDIQKDAFEFALKFAKDETESVALYLRGRPGRGKTHLANAIAETYRYFDKTVLFIDAPSLLAKVRESYSYQSSYSQEEIMKVAKEVDLLVLDDIGAEYVKKDGDNESWAVEVLFQVINARRGKKTVYTSNYDSAALVNKYGKSSERIISRMMEGATVIELDGEDYRIKNTQVWRQSNAR